MDADSTRSLREAIDQAERDLEDHARKQEYYARKKLEHDRAYEMKAEAIAKFRSAFMNPDARVSLSLDFTYWCILQMMVTQYSLYSLMLVLCTMRAVTEIRSAYRFPFE
jgi:hypothetical protein